MIGAKLKIKPEKKIKRVNYYNKNAIDILNTYLENLERKHP
jgi:hypothetical protein